MCIDITIRPTVPHCSLATLIGLCIRTAALTAMPHVKVERRASELKLSAARGAFSRLTRVELS
jgi:hypothetical protein